MGRIRVGGAGTQPPVVAEILENEGNPPGDTGDGCEDYDDRHDHQDRVEEDTTGVGCDFVDLGCHTSHVAGPRPDQLLGMTPIRP